MIVFRGPLDKTVSMASYSTLPVEFKSESSSRISLEELSNITISGLCQIQQDFRLNKTNDSLAFDNDNISLSDVLDALHLDHAFFTSDIVGVSFWYKFIMVSLFIFCLIWGFFTNTHTFIAVAIEKSAWTSTNLLIAALALSDLVGVVVITLPEITSIMNDIEVWNFGSAGCVTIPFLQTCSILTNALIICFIAYDRYLGVVRLVNKGCMKQPVTIAVLIVMIWVFSIGIALPQFWFWKTNQVILVDDIPPEISVEFCQVFQMCLANINFVSPTHWSVFHVYYFCLCSIIFCPLFLAVAVIYAAIGHSLYIRKPVGTGVRTQQDKRRKRVLWALFSLVATFFVCRVPNWVYVIYIMVQPVNVTEGLLMLKSFLVFLSVLNTTLNPFLYVRINETMRKTLRNCSVSLFEHLTCCGSCCQGPSLVEQPMRTPNQNRWKPSLRRNASTGNSARRTEDSTEHQRHYSEFQTEDLPNNSGEPGLLTISSELTRASMMMATPQWAWTENARV